MRICHFTNTFLPHIGGVARAVQTLLEDQRKARHHVLVVAPEFDEGTAPRRIERHVERISAITHFNESDFSVRLPFAATLSRRLADFRTDIIHAHHPFLLGDTALREAASRQVPILFTHHTLYENYTHYLPLESEAAGDFASEIATRFANRCDAVVAPSQSVRELIVSRGVTVPVHVIPTGIDTRKIAAGKAARARKRWDIPANVPVIGHLGRLAPEKNLGFLSRAIAKALDALPKARALIVGDGPSRDDMVAIFKEAGVAKRVIFTGKLTGNRLHDAYAAMTQFAFSSTSETQGLVLAEAMAAGNPVIALDASGVREVVQDRHNGRLLSADTTPATFARALVDLAEKTELRDRWSQAALETAATFDRKHTTGLLLTLYKKLIFERRHRERDDEHDNPIAHALRPVVDRVAIEGGIIADKTGALLDSFTGEASPSEHRTA